jgi:uncharacterized protein YbjT (DUF2867 family)
MSSQRPVLVLGATGKTGRRVMARLETRGIAVRPGSRAAEPPFDWREPASWPAVLDGVEAAYLSYYPDLALPGAADAVAMVARLAVEGGAKRLVLLSGRGEPEAQAAEQAVRAVAPQLTVLRCSWFCQNFSEDYLRDPITAGHVVLPTGAVPEPFVDAGDIADVAVAALTEDGHAGELYELTGPRALTFAQAVDEIASTLDHPVAFETVTVEDYAAAMTQEGVPDEVVKLTSYLFGEVLDGRNAQPEDGVERALGRPPRDFRQFVRTATESGEWAK